MKTYLLMVRTKGGIFGEAGRFEFEDVAEKIAADLRQRAAGGDEGRIFFNPPGFGFSAPCPIGAIEETLVIPEGDTLPISWLTIHHEKTGVFAKAFDQAGKAQ